MKLLVVVWRRLLEWTKDKYEKKLFILTVTLQNALFLMGVINTLNQSLLLDKTWKTELFVFLFSRLQSSNSLSLLSYPHVFTCHCHQLSICETLWNYWLARGSRQQTAFARHRCSHPCPILLRVPLNRFSNLVYAGENPQPWWPQIFQFPLKLFSPHDINYLTRPLLENQLC